MFIVVSYDISDDRRRTRVMNALKDFGRRVQYSVFECDLTAEQYKRLRTRLAGLLDRSEDNLRYYPLCEEDVKKRRVEGVERNEAQLQAVYVVRGDRERR